jgi:hypothetical protein
LTQNGTAYKNIRAAMDKMATDVCVR